MLFYSYTVFLDAALSTLTMYRQLCQLFFTLAALTPSLRYPLQEFFRMFLRGCLLQAVLCTLSKCLFFLVIPLYLVFFSTSALACDRSLTMSVHDGATLERGGWAGRVVHWCSWTSTSIVVLSSFERGRWAGRRRGTLERLQN